MAAVWPREHIGGHHGGCVATWTHRWPCGQQCFALLLKLKTANHRLLKLVVNQLIQYCLLFP